MGCDHSRTVRVQPIGPASLTFRDKAQCISGTEGSTQTTDCKEKRHRSRSAESTTREYDLDEHGKKRKHRKKHSRSSARKDLLGSSDSLDDRRSPADSDRGFSATSKQSADSGLGEDNGDVITEFSEEDKIKEVEKDFKTADGLDLAISGVPCRSRTAVRQDEARVLQRLREEGLISRPRAKAAGGLCFEIVEEGEGRVPRPPPRLQTLAVMQAKTKTKLLTQADIREKLDRAERRRKKKEQERLEKLRDMERGTEAVAALENFAEYQKNKQLALSQRMEHVQDNRQRHLENLMERQQKRSILVQEVVKSTEVVEGSSDVSQRLKKEQTDTPATEDRPQTPEVSSETDLTSGDL